MSALALLTLSRGWIRFLQPSRWARLQWPSFNMRRMPLAIERGRVSKHSELNNPKPDAKSVKPIRCINALYRNHNVGTIARFGKTYIRQYLKKKEEGTLL